MAVLWLLVEVAASVLVASHDGPLSDMFPMVWATPECEISEFRPRIPKPEVAIVRRDEGVNGWRVDAANTDCVVVSFHRPAGFAGHVKFERQTLSARPGNPLPPYATGELYTTSFRGGRYTVTAVGPGGTTTIHGALSVARLTPWEALWHSFTA